MFMVFLSYHNSRHLKGHCDEKIVCLLLISIRNHLNIHLQDARDFQLLKAVNLCELSIFNPCELMFMIIYSPSCEIQLAFLPQRFVLNWDVGSTNVQINVKTVL